MKRNTVPDPAVVRLIEVAERRFVEEHGAALTEEQERQQGRKICEVGDAFLVVQNKSSDERVGTVGGFATAGPVTRADFDRVLDVLADEGVATIRFPLVPGAQEAEIAGWLADAGFERRQGGINWIAPTSAAKPASPDYDIRLVGADEGMTFAKIVAVNYHYKPGTDLTALAGEVGTPGYATFLAYVDGVPVATGRLHGSEDVCAFGYGTTLRAFRKRGIQNEMIAARLRHARDLGYEWAIAGTMGNDRSSRNLCRQGFKKAHTVDVYVRASNSLTPGCPVGVPVP